LAAISSPKAASALMLFTTREGATPVEGMFCGAGVVASLAFRA